MVASLFASLLRPLVRRAIVEGHSMIPTYEPGERVWLVRRLRPLRAGDVVIFTLPHHPELSGVKRVASLDRASVTLLGDNQYASRDSREFGPVAPREIRWLVRPHRAG